MDGRTRRLVVPVMLVGCAAAGLAALAVPAVSARTAKQSPLLGRYLGHYHPDGAAATGDLELTVSADRPGNGGRSLLGRGRLGRRWQRLMGNYNATADQEAFTCVLHRGSRGVVISMNLSFGRGAKIGVGDYLITRDHLLLEHGTLSVTRP